MYSSSSFGPFTLILLSPREFPSLTNFEKVNSKETVLDLSFPKILDQVNWTLSKNSIRDGSKGDVLTGWKGGRLVRDKRRRRTKRESVVLYKLNRTLVQHQVSRSASPSHFCPSCSSLLSQNGGRVTATRISNKADPNARNNVNWWADPATLQQQCRSRQGKQRRKNNGRPLASTWTSRILLPILSPGGNSISMESFPFPEDF